MLILRLMLALKWIATLVLVAFAVMTIWVEPKLKGKSEKRIAYLWVATTLLSVAAIWI